MRDDTTTTRDRTADRAFAGAMFVGVWAMAVAILVIFALLAHILPATTEIAR